MTRPLPPILLHLLLDTVHARGELIQTLAIILCLPGGGLRLLRCSLRL